ncbi:DMT family transporter [Listeria grandensis]|uniref:DMT family transporter n=1 Tax=Listeria grandensis TaxID=1494963 RepID=A0A7X1CQP6_9LIST|nr:DMT family transporter [Listeria grandensis]MBC1474069.1 DMT family transporter [Listeria grandensis]MBC1937268.1 DMT family transporter [Listeria grandensis]
MTAKKSKSMIAFMCMGLVAGMMSPIQTSINSRLRIAVDSPIIASLISFLVGMTLLLILSLLVERRLTFQLRGVGRIPWWIFTGGALGVIFVTSNILLLPLLGSALTVVLALCGQMIIALTIDHFGWFGIIPHPINRYRLLGVLSMIGGVLLIQWF